VVGAIFLQKLTDFDKIEELYLSKEALTLEQVQKELSQQEDLIAKQKK
jgi:hypothetical protein